MRPGVPGCTRGKPSGRPWGLRRGRPTSEAIGTRRAPVRPVQMTSSARADCYGVGGADQACRQLGHFQLGASSEANSWASESNPVRNGFFLPHLGQVGGW
jgi:hypothetical protein